MINSRTLRETIRIVVRSGAALVLLFHSFVSYGQLVLVEESDAVSHGRVLGSVTTVLDGRATGSLFRKVPAGAFCCALGAGAIADDPAQQGEALILNGSMLVRSVDPGCGYCTRQEAPTAGEVFSQA